MTSSLSFNSSELRVVAVDGALGRQHTIGAVGVVGTNEACVLLLSSQFG